MRTLSIDIETYSSVALKKAGLYKYVQSPDFEIMLFAWAFDNDPVQLVDLKNGEQIPYDVYTALFDMYVTKRAYNATFEWYCLSKYFDTPYDDLNGYTSWLSQWQCTQLHGLYCGYPMGLGAISEAIGLPQDKKKLGTGGSLIRTFCVPCKPTKSNGMRTRTLPHHEPERWELFKEYCKGDVVAERAVARKLKHFPVPHSEQKLWELDVAMNAAGVGLDAELVESALWLNNIVMEELTQEAITLTGVSNPKSVQQLTKWISEELDEEVTTLKKDDVASMLAGLIGVIPADALDPFASSQEKVKRLLELRQEMSKTSIRKYAAMQACIGADGRGRGFLQHYGANRTGRYAGRIVQIQNLPRNFLKMLALAREFVKARKLDAVKLIFGSVPDTLSQLIRTAFVPAEGKSFVIVDYSAIEARVVAWLAGEQWVLDVFAKGEDVYSSTYSKIYNVPLELVDKNMRQRGKVAVLGLGYGMGDSKFKETSAKSYKIEFTEEEAKDIVRKWRKANPNIVQLWSNIGNAAIDVVKHGGSKIVKYVVLYTTYDPESNLAFLVIRLPSGRELYYPNPSLRLNQWGRDELQFWGVDQEAKKWGLIKTYGAKLVENITQAVARDCLTDSLTILTERGHHVAFHVHDEHVIESDTYRADAVLKEALAVMAEPVPWAPGLLLGGAGFVCEYYQKD